MGARLRGGYFRSPTPADSRFVFLTRQKSPGTGGTPALATRPAKGRPRIGRRAVFVCAST
jgi:hypothetical protein